MNKNFLIELTNNLYRLTLLFPKKEPLRYKLREVADEVLANFITWQSINSANPGKFLIKREESSRDLIFIMQKDLEILKGYFEIAKWQNWVSYFDILEIEEEYDKIESDFQKELEESKIELNKTKKRLITPTNKVKNQISLGVRDSRKEKILEFLKEKGKAQVWQANGIFPEVSKRTLRRDFAKLLEQGLVERIGERNNTFYQLKTLES